MKILFRADANKNIGFGHVMRNLALADSLTQKVNECIFVCADDSFEERIAERGYRCIVLGTDYTDMEGELSKLQDVLEEEKPDRIVVDSYFVTNVYFKTIKKYAKTIYFDDVLSFAYDTDILIDYNVNATKEEYLSLYEGREIPKLLLGASYAPLKKEYAKTSVREQPKKAKYVLVSVGGADPLHVAISFMKMIEKSDELKKNLVFRFVLSNMEPDIAIIKEKEKEAAWLEVYENVKDMKTLMEKSDMALSASGSTQYELCACGVPTVNFSLADNQVPGGVKFGELGIFRYAGDLRDGEAFFAKVKDILVELYKDEEMRTKMAKKAHALTDGRGAERLAEELMNE